MIHRSFILALIVCGLLAGTSWSAEEQFEDRIEVNGGAVLLGSIKSVEDRELTLVTDYAGVLTVQLSSIVAVSLSPQRATGLPEYLIGKELPQEEKPKPAEVAKSPPPTPKSVDDSLPDWKIEAGLNLNGKSGNSERFDVSLALEAELERKFDRINLYGNYAYGTNRGVRSVDEIKVGGRYTNFFFNKTGLFVREELEKDEFEGLQLRSTSAFGVSYKFKDEKNLQIEGRSGVSYRYEDYLDDGNGEFPGMDIGIEVFWQFANWANFKGTYTYLPSIDNFDDFIIEQDSGFNLPLKASDLWKLRFGITSQYNNQPERNRERMDLKYYARLIASWD